MKKLVLTLCLLLASVSVFAEGLSSASLCQQGKAALQPSFDLSVLAPAAQELKAMPVKSGLIPAWCSSRNTNYCTFGYNVSTACCYATYTAPGAFCGTICR